MLSVLYAFFYGFLFTIPWENSVMLPGVGTVARLMGLLALAAGLLYIVMAKRLRFHWIIFWFAAFTAWAGITALWVQGGDVIRVQTFAQLLIMVALIVQMFPERRHVERAFCAVVLGCYVTAISAIHVFLTNQDADYQRFTAEGFNPNTVAMILNIGIALAWWLLVGSDRGALRRLIGLGFLPLGYAAVLLSASRTGFLGLVVASLYPVLVVAYRPVFRRAIVSLVLVVMAASVAVLYLVPETSWARIGTIGNEVQDGTLNHRTVIWVSGLALFDQNSLMGVGAGNFSKALKREFGWGLAPHNVFLVMAVEYGLIGFFIFGGILVAGFGRVPWMPVPERRLWYIIGLMMFLVFMSSNWEWRKQTWLVLGLAATHSAACQRERALA